MVVIVNKITILPIHAGTMLNAKLLKTAAQVLNIETESLLYLPFALSFDLDLAVENGEKFSERLCTPASSFGFLLLRQELESLLQLLIRGGEFRVGSFEASVFDCKFCELLLEVSGVLLLSLTECTLGCSILCSSSLLKRSIRIYNCNGGRDSLTPLVAWVFSGTGCVTGIEIDERGLYIGPSSVEPKSLGVSGIG